MTEPEDFTPYPLDLPAPPDRRDQPPRIATPGHLVGRADGVDIRTRTDPAVQTRLVTVLGFRLLVPGSAQPLEVELRGLSLTGAVRDGDWVEIADRPAAGGTYAVAGLTNLTTNVPVSVQGPRKAHPAVVAGFIVFMLLVVLAGCGVLVAVLGSS